LILISSNHVNAIYSSNKSKVDRNKPNAYNVAEKKSSISLENKIISTKKEIFDVKSMIAESNFITEASFSVH
jgi:hypothetical protein